MSTPKWAERARRRMRELGIRQKDLIEPLGVTSRGALGHYFAGRRHLKLEQAVALARALRMPFDELFVEGASMPGFPLTSPDWKSLEAEVKPDPGSSIDEEMRRALEINVDEHEMDLVIDAVRLVGEVYKQLGGSIDPETFAAHVLQVYRAMHQGQQVTRRKVVQLVSSSR